MELTLTIIHLLATALWIGGSFYSKVILEPSLRTLEGNDRARLEGMVAKRFSITAWISILILIVTGYLKTPDGMMFDTSSSVGITLLVKHVLVAAVVALGLGIALIAVPRVRKASPKPGEQPTPEFFRAQNLLHLLTWITTIFGFIILILATLL